MRILLDECIDVRFRHSFAEYDCKTARFAGFAGLRNGRLLLAAESAGFDVVITVDQNISHQQNLSERKIALILMGVARTRLPDLQTLVPQIKASLASIRAGDIVFISHSRGGEPY